MLNAANLSATCLSGKGAERRRMNPMVGAIGNGIKKSCGRCEWWWDRVAEIC